MEPNSDYTFDARLDRTEVTIQLVGDDPSEPSESYVVAKNSKGTTIHGPQGVPNIEMELNGTRLTWGSREFEVSDETRARNLVALVTATRSELPTPAIKQPDTSTSPPARTSSAPARASLASAAEALIVIGAVIGLLSICGGIYLLTYTDDAEEYPFIGVGISSIASGIVFSATFYFFATFAKAWLESTKQSSD